MSFSTTPTTTASAAPKAAAGALRSTAYTPSKTEEDGDEDEGDYDYSCNDGPSVPKWSVMRAFCLKELEYELAVCFGHALVPRSEGGLDVGNIALPNESRHAVYLHEVFLGKPV